MVLPLILCVPNPVMRKPHGSGSLGPGNDAGIGPGGPPRFAISSRSAMVA